MQVEVSDSTYKLLQRMSAQRGDESLRQTLEDVIQRSHVAQDEAQQIYALVQEGVRSAAEEPLVDGEAFFQSLRARRNKAA